MNVLRAAPHAVPRAARATIVLVVAALVTSGACDKMPQTASPDTGDAGDASDAETIADVDLADGHHHPDVDALDARDASDASDTDPPPPPCLTTAPTACPDPAPTFAVDVGPIVERVCVPCHYGALGGPWPLTDYGHVSDWRDDIRGAMLDCSMPPPEENVPMTTEERMTVLRWIRCGMPP